MPTESQRPVNSDTTITWEDLQADLRGETLVSARDDPSLPIDEVLAFFNDPERQRRLEEAEIHHDRAPLAGVIREFEADPVFASFFARPHQPHNARLRRIVGVLVRMVMERRGWRSTGRSSSLGVVSSRVQRPRHNANGLSMWFSRAERFAPAQGLPFENVRTRCREFEKVAGTDGAPA